MDNLLNRKKQIARNYAFCSCLIHKTSQFISSTGQVPSIKFLTALYVCKLSTIYLTLKCFLKQCHFRPAPYTKNGTVPTYSTQLSEGHSRGGSVVRGTMGQGMIHNSRLQPATIKIKIVIQLYLPNIYSTTPDLYI